MKKKVNRLISENAVCRMLHISEDELSSLCAEGTIERFKTSSSLYQYDFNKIIEYRKSLLNGKDAAGPKPAAAAAGPATFPHPAPALPKVALTEVNPINVQDLIIEKKIERQLKTGTYRRIEPSVARFFVECPLYVRMGDTDTYSLYKPPGKTVQVETGSPVQPPMLYIAESDWPLAFDELQRGLLGQIDLLVGAEQFDKVKFTIVSLLDMLLFEHDLRVIEGLEELVEALVSASTKRQTMIMNLVPLLEANTTLGLHSARIMALVMKFCFKNDYSAADTKMICISAVLHDIGKTMLSGRAATSDPSLLKDEADIRAYMMHPQIGFTLLADCGIRNKVIDYGALEHHERLDGSGFPYGKTKISFLGQIIGIVDTFDSIRNATLLAGMQFSPMEALKILKKDCEEGKFSKEIFESFVYSLL